MGLGSLLLQFPRYEHLTATSASFIVNWRQACSVPLSSNRPDICLILSFCSICELGALARAPYMWTASPSRTPRASFLGFSLQPSDPQALFALVLQIQPFTICLKATGITMTTSAIPFVLQLASEEWSDLKCQIATSNWGEGWVPLCAFPHPAICILNSALRIC
jgi:hypothetical protein